MMQALAVLLMVAQLIAAVIIGPPPQPAPPAVVSPVPASVQSAPHWYTATMPLSADTLCGGCDMWIRPAMAFDIGGVTEPGGIACTVTARGLYCLADSKLGSVREGAPLTLYVTACWDVDVTINDSTRRMALACGGE